MGDSGRIAHLLMVLSGLAPLAIGSAALVAACQAPAPAEPTAAQAKPAAASPAPARAAAEPSPAAKTEGPAEWEKQWEALVDAARKEGRVVLQANPLPDLRAGIPAKFKERFGIEVEYIGGTGTDLAARVERERLADLYLVDVIVGGAVTLITKHYPSGWLDPVRPALIHPEITDTARWRAGKLPFLDPEGQYALMLTYTLNSFGGINTSKVDPDDLKSAQGLVSPKLKGMIAGEDPTIGGSGQLAATYMYLQFGEDFVRKLYREQDFLVSRDRRGLSDGLARGTRPILFGHGDADAEYARLKDQGFPVQIINGFEDAPGITSPASNILQLVNRAPHPNAAKLLVNWLASREGGEVYARLDGKASTRADLDNSWVPTGQIPKPGVTYLNNADWDFVQNQRTVVAERIKAIVE